MNDDDITLVSGCLAAHPIASAVSTSLRHARPCSRSTTRPGARFAPTRSVLKNKENALAQLAEIVKFATRAKERLP